MAVSQAVKRLARSAGGGPAERALANALVEGGFLWLIGRSAVFLALLVGWLGIALALG